ncbi:AraC family transcriptional regulator [Cryptosporangium japonicum]|uniref:AraC family transcriptional regulator n=1 Tax=Cryptosporangium japonicum TaxID=80872 RepID=UPI003CD05AD2
MVQDPLHGVLSLLDARGHVSAGLTAGGRWAVAFAAPDGVKFNVVREGRCWLRVGDVTVRLGAGDCYLLTRPVPYVLASDLAAPAVPAGVVFADASDGMARAGTGADVVLVGGRFSFGDRAGTVLLDALPPVIHVPGGEADALRWALDEIGGELRSPALGSRLVAEHLAVVLFVRILRWYLGRPGAAVTGWLAGLADPVVGAALRAVHAAPAAPWTVASLAAAASVSRSTLAARFTAVVGRAPLEYLTGWRMELASSRLRRGDEPVAAIARSVGYGSETAFSTAFKRVVGASPRDYRRSVTTRATRR